MSQQGIDSFTRSMRKSAKRKGRRGDHALASVMKGVLIGASITVICVAVFALLLSWWDASDRAVTAINQVVKFVAILAAVATAIQHGGGPMRGCVTGLLYMTMGIVVCSLLMGKSPDMMAYLADLGMGLAAGGLFAMILTTGKAA
ncbi:MAG: YrzE family protein [Clostridia bacterium]|nr:YrzE family protein [Clostridia bacterium]